jgi:hypothetical protein
MWMRLAQHTIRQPYGLETFGAFRSLVLNGDFTPKVSLRAVMAKHPITGVGAVADARGEITIYDSKLIVSYGKEALHAIEEESAALLSIGTVPGWQTITVERDVAQLTLKLSWAGWPMLTVSARTSRFPFQIRGSVASYVMHVNAAPTNAPHGMEVSRSP